MISQNRNTSQQRQTDTGRWEIVGRSGFKQLKGGKSDMSVIRVMEGGEER